MQLIVMARDKINQLYSSISYPIFVDMDFSGIIDKGWFRNNLLTVEGPTHYWKKYVKSRY